MSPEQSRSESRLGLVLIVNVAIVAAQAVAGIVANSLGLLADAGHNLADVGAVLLSLVAMRWATKQPTGRRSFGYHRGTILAAQANAASLLAVTVLIAFEGVRRLLHPDPVEGGLVVAVAVAAALANAGCAGLLRHRRADLNVRSALLHMGGDALSSTGVAVAGAVILVTGRFFWLDPAVSLAISALIGWQAYRLLRATTDVLLESTPRGVDPGEVAEVIEAVPGVETVHDLHVWSLSSEVRALSAHLVLAGHPTLEEAQAVAVEVKRAIALPFRIAHATFELECEQCVVDEPWCPIDEVARTSEFPH